VDSHEPELSTPAGAAARRRRAVATALAIPGAARLAVRLARRLAGRHYVAAVGAVLTDDDVLLVQHTFRHPGWALPGGWVRIREDPAAACVREIREETGLAIEPLAVVGCDLHANDGIPIRYSGITVGFACRPLPRSSTAVAARSVELQAVEWRPIAQALDVLTGFERFVVEAARRTIRG
jgi:ADP-ribose pyrophosphatase YjhB (NUDIX family)